MTQFDYILNIPDASHDPSADQPGMKINNNSIPGIINVDHIGFGIGSPPGGTHRQVNLTNEASPARLSDLVLYSKLAGGQSALWAKNSGQDLPLFTGPALGGTSGYSSIYGGIVLQWGFVSKNIATGGDNGTVSFTTGIFNNICFIVNTTPISDGTHPNSALSVAVQLNSASKSGFDWYAYTNSSDYKGFYWFAIGN